MTTTVNLGKIAFTWKGTYSAGTTYAKQDVVAYNGNTYISLVDSNVGNTPATLTAYWQVMASGVSAISTTAGQVIYNNGSGLAALPIGTTGQVLTVSSSGYPNWENSNVMTGSIVKALWSNTDRDNGQYTVYRLGACIMTDNSVRVWGYNGNGQLGDGTTTTRIQSMRPAFPPSFPGASKIYMNYQNNGYCIDTAGQLWTWGYNTHGQLGDTTTTARYWPKNVSLIATNSIYGKTVTKLFINIGNDAAQNVIAQCSDGTLHYFGYNGYGALGAPTPTAVSTITALTGFGTAKTGDASVCAGAENYASTYVVNTLGELWVTGYNVQGQLGDSTTTSRSAWYKNTLGSLGGKQMAKVYASRNGAFAIDTLGNIHAWGTNTYGDTGNGSTALAYTPSMTYAVTGGVTAVHIVAGKEDYQVSYALMSDGTVKACGAGNYGANGSTGATAITTWTTLSIPVVGGETVTKIVPGGSGSYNWVAFLTSTGRIITMGYNGNGQLCDGTAVNKVGTFAIANTSSPVADITTTGYSSEGTLIALHTDGQLSLGGYGGTYCNLDFSANNTYSLQPAVF